MTEQQTCETCRYWAPGNQECRHNAPVCNDDRASKRWPHVGSVAWCGEHKPIKAKKPEGVSNHVWHEAQRETEQALKTE